MPRLLGVFAAGRIIDATLARSQFIGGMTMGLGMALMEATASTRRRAASSAGTWRSTTSPPAPTCRTSTRSGSRRHDPHLNPMGAKGIGEIGITGTAAAIGNAVYHATGRRVRDLPITPAKLLS